MHISLIYTDRDPWALGMRGLSSILKERGYHTRLIFMGSDGAKYPRGTLERARGLVKDSGLIGVSCLSRGSEKAKQVIQYLKPLQKPIIWGGLHATLNPDECAQYADMACVGEGEDVIVELASRVSEHRRWNDISNLVYKNNGSLVRNPLRPLIADLDQLPLVDFTCEDEFHLQDGKTFLRPSHLAEVTESYEIVFNGSRGCGFHCTYCCNAKLKQIYSKVGRYVRKMSISRYIEYTKKLKQHFPQAKYFYLIDEDFLARSVDELKEFSERFPKEVGMPFECCGSPLQISDEKMDLLVKAGLWRIRMGIESGSERTKREIYKRPMSNAAVRRAVEVISRHAQVIPYYFLLITNPYEEEEDLLETLRVMSSLPGSFFVQAFNLVFFPGSALYQRALNDGLITGKEDSGYELDFRGGLRYKGHSWKYKNLYLNALLFMMEGKSTRLRIGSLPRFMIPILTSPNVINFNKRFLIITKLMIESKVLTLSLRSKGASVLRYLIGDPRAIYNIRDFIEGRLLRG